MEAELNCVIRSIVSTMFLAVLTSSSTYAGAAPEHAERQTAKFSRSQAAGRGHSMTPQVTADLRSAHRLQVRGEITAARNCAIRAWIGANIAHSIPTTSRSLNPVLLFPEHDSLHFFAWNTATELVYIDASHNSVKLTWRASLEPAAPNSAYAKMNAPYTFVRESVVLHEDGSCGR